ncbi:MAG: YunC family protein [Candidatus Bathyarchaeia archaeon]
MINVAQVKVGNKTCLGVKVELPESPPLILILAEKGFVMCGFLNIEVAERWGVVAAMVSGVKTFEDILNAEVKAATSKAKGMGVQPGMRGAEALARML